MPTKMTLPDVSPKSHRLPCSDSGTKPISLCSAFGTLLSFAPSPEFPPAHLRAKLLTLLVLLVTNRGVIEYLVWAKDQEQDKWLADDIAIAIRTCALAAEGCKDPNVVATYEILGCHPDQLQSLIEERRRAILGNLYEAFYGVPAVRIPEAAGAGVAATNPSDPLPPRKPPSPELPHKVKGAIA